MYITQIESIFNFTCLHEIRGYVDCFVKRLQLKCFKLCRVNGPRRMVYPFTMFSVMNQPLYGRNIQCIYFLQANQHIPASFNISTKPG